jgi:hypothetical protein
MFCDLDLGKPAPHGHNEEQCKKKKLRAQGPIKH